MKKVLRLKKRTPDYDICLKSVNNLDEFISKFENNIFYYNAPENSISFRSINLMFPEYLKKTVEGVCEVKYDSSLLINLNNLEPTSRLLFPLAMVYLSSNQFPGGHKIELTNSDFLEEKIYLADSDICGKIKQIFEEGRIKKGYAINPSRFSKELFR